VWERERERQRERETHIVCISNTQDGLICMTYESDVMRNTTHESCLFAQEPYISAKEPYFSTQDPYVFKKAPKCLQKKINEWKTHTHVRVCVCVCAQRHISSHEQTQWEFSNTRFERKNKGMNTRKMWIHAKCIRRRALYLGIFIAHIHTYSYKYTACVYIATNMRKYFACACMLMSAQIHSTYTYIFI